MQLNSIDWIVIALYFLFNLAVGFYLRKRATQSVSDFFVSGRNVTWWLAGTSMVATTFAADTPLVVSGLVARNGIAGNWIWWSIDRKSTRLNSSHLGISYAVFCLKKKTKTS